MSFFFGFAIFPFQVFFIFHVLHLVLCYRVSSNYYKKKVITIVSMSHIILTTTDSEFGIASSSATTGSDSTITGCTFLFLFGWLYCDGTLLLLVKLLLSLLLQVLPEVVYLHTLNKCLTFSSHSDGTLASYCKAFALITLACVG